MAEKSNVFKQQVKHIGYLEFRDLYNFCRDWFSDENYDLYELKYDERITAKGKEIIIEWAAKKKVSDYFRNVIEVRWHILNMIDTEIEKDGKKEKVNKGEVKITFSADLVKDYENKWEDKPIWKFLRGIYDKYIIRTTIDEYEVRLTEKTAELVSQVKSFLQLEGN